MKILTSFCERLEIIREILPDADVRCIDEADEEFVESADVLIVFHFRDVKDVIPRMKNLKLIQTLTAGTDHITFTLSPGTILMK
jgi:lactate dehydrogenase-like 2-hydroxyacid dehydrogenase